jgi:uncharacterized membrane protein
MINIESIVNWLALVFSMLGVVIVIIAGITAFYQYLKLKFPKKTEIDFNLIRKNFVEQILLSLEFFVGADLMRTIAAPTLNEIGILAAIVGIRIAFQFSLIREEKLPD